MDLEKAWKDHVGKMESKEVRCPKCGKTGVKLDPEKGLIVCPHCGWTKRTVMG